jgi:hypothetical protein
MLLTGLTEIGAGRNAPSLNMSNFEVDNIIFSNLKSAANDMKHMYDNSWKVYTTTVIVDIDNVRHPVVTALLETVAVIYTANSSPTDYIIDADMRRGIESVLDREQKSFEFDLGTWTYRIDNETIDGDGKIRIKITTVHN